MKRNYLFVIGAVAIPLLLWGASLLYSYFYPKQYVLGQDGEYVNVNAKEEDTFPVNKNTTFVMEYYYPEENRTLRENVKSIPDLLGCSEEEVRQYLTDYMKHLSKQDQEEGLSNYEMVSYKGQEIHLRKTYRTSVQKGFIAKSYNGMVVILKSDGKTVYEYTEINIATLPETLREQILAGLSIENEEELYNFLENYSS